jgi:hypothetical protein
MAANIVETGKQTTASQTNVTKASGGRCPPSVAGTLSRGIVARSLLASHLADGYMQ